MKASLVFSLGLLAVLPAGIAKDFVNLNFESARRPLQFLDQPNGQIVAAKAGAFDLSRFGLSRGPRRRFDVDADFDRL